MMVSLDAFPCELKEIIFSRIRIRDLYEVSVVSEAWWWLTVKTYKGILSEEDQLIKTLLDFYNREKKLPTPLVWFNLVKYANFRGLRLRPHTFTTPAVLENFLESKNPIRALLLQSMDNSFFDARNQSIQIKLDDILKYFPYLNNLKLLNFTAFPWKLPRGTLNIPKGIKQVHMVGIEVNGVAWSDLFEDPSAIESLEIDIKGLTYDPYMFANLRRLSLHFDRILADHEMKNVLDLIRGHKFLKSVKLVGAQITKDWFSLFAKTVENIGLQTTYIEEEFLNELGNDGCYERRVMSFVCSDFRAVKRFHLQDLRTDVFDEEDEEDTDIDYHGKYTCRPQLMEEELRLKLHPSLSREVQAITTTDSGLSLRNLTIVSYNDRVELLRASVPTSVKKLRLSLPVKLENFSIGQLCAEPQNLESLLINTLEETTSLFIQRNWFVVFTHLKILEMRHLDREGIQNLLQQCVSLEKLTLIWPDRGCFTDLSPACVSKTIREVTLDGSDARLEDVLYVFPNLEVLRMSENLTCPLSLPTAMAKLKFFSLKFDRYSVIRDHYRRLVLLINSVDVPCMLFHLGFGKSSLTFKFGWNDRLIDDFCKGNNRGQGSAYCRGLPTRFFEAREIEIFDDVKQFSEILK